MLYLDPSALQPATIAAPPVAPVTPVTSNPSILSRVTITHLNTNLFSPCPLPHQPINSDDSDFDQTTSANATFHSLDPGDL